MRNVISPRDPDQVEGLRLPNRMGLASQVVADAGELAPEDRDLVLALYMECRPTTQVAKEWGLHVKTVRRRLNRLMERMRSPVFRFVIRQRPAWSPFRREVAQAVILRGETIQATATRLGVSFHRVRHEMGHIRALCDALLEME